jgi:hypothetical protein
MGALPDYPCKGTAIWFHAHRSMAEALAEHEGLAMHAEMAAAQAA